MKIVNKNIAIVTSSLTAPGATMLQQAFAARGQTADIVLLGDGYSAAGRINTSDIVILRIGPKSFAMYRDTVLPSLENVKHKKLLTRMLEAFDKSIQTQKLRDRHVPVPATRIIHDISELSPWLPCVLKQPTGNQGNGVFLVHDEVSVKQTARQMIASSGSCIQQEYIHIRPATDKRLLVVGDTVVAAMKRTAHGADFRSNLHQGGSSEAYTPLPSECDLAIRATQALELPFCGVDIIDGPTEPLVLEVNPSPGFAIAQTTGIAVPNIIAQHYIEGVLE